MKGRIVRTEILLVTLLLIAVLIPSTGAAALPEVSHFTQPGPDTGEMWLILGHNFVPGRTQVVHYQPAASQPDPTAETGWTKEVGKAQALPAQPPQEARPLEIVDATDSALVVRGVGPRCPLYVFWVRTPEGLSKPQLANLPDPYWVGRGRLEPGEISMVFGNRCNIEFRPTARIVLKPQGGGEPRQVEVLKTSEHNRTGGIVPFRVPEGTPAGRYELWLHNGSGGRWGWGGPVPVEITPKAKAPAVVSARSHGARGDGYADDTAALRTALKAAGDAAAAAGERGRAVLAIEPGTYNISSTLVVPEGVLLRGAGEEMTRLRGTGYDPAGPRRAWNSNAAEPAAVLQLTSYTGMEDLTVSGFAAEGTGSSTVQVQGARVMDDVTGVSVRHCRIQGLGHPNVPSYGQYMRVVPVEGLRVSHSVSWLEIYDSVFRDCSLNLGRICSNARIVGNDLLGIGGRAFNNCYLARNQVHGGFKGFTTSVWPESNYHNFYVLNKVYDVASGREGSDGEEFCIHGEGSTKFGRRAGPVTAATAVSITDSGAAWAPDQMKNNHVAIIGGRGAGQYRLIKSNTATTVTVDRPWAVVPDASSSYLAAGTHVENTYLFNTTWSGNWMLLYKGQIGNVVQGHETDRSAGLTLQSNDNSVEGKPETYTEISLGWYNEYRDCLLDNSSIKFWPMAGPANMRRAPNTMGNKVKGCIFRNSLPNENSFTGSRTNPVRGGLQGAISFSQFNNQGDNRATVPKDPHTWIAYTFIEGNQFANTGVGIAVAEFTDRTFATGNTFWDVQLPLIDLGSGTRFWNNSRQWFDKDGRQTAPLEEERSLRPGNDAWQKVSAGTMGAGRELAVPKAAAARPVLSGAEFMHRINVVDDLVAASGGYFYNMNDPAVVKGCRDNLAVIWKALRGYADKHKGLLPDAAFYPDPLAAAGTKTRSLGDLLGLSGQPCLVCPGSGPEQKAYGLTYVWNEVWNGRKLSDIPDAKNEWLVMELIGVNPFVAHRIGHQHGTHVLYADGSVRLKTYTDSSNLGAEWTPWTRLAEAAKTARSGDR